MKERELTSNVNLDETPAKLKPKTKEKILSCIDTLQLNLSVLKQHITKDELEVGFKETLLSGINFNATDILKELDFESVLVKENEERFSRIRSLNTENRSLREQLGEKVSDEDVREAFKNITSRLKGWAKSLGLYIREVSLNSYGATVQLDPGISSIIFNGDDDRNIPTFESIKKIREDKGYEFMEGYGRDQADLIMNDKNVALLKTEILNQFFDCGFNEFKIRSSSRGLELSEIEFFIRDLSQIPVNTKEK